MARVTVEDCLEREDNRFALVRARIAACPSDHEGVGAPGALEEQGRGHGVYSEMPRARSSLRPSEPAAVQVYIEELHKREFG